jgi:hypothetical protein
MKITNSQLRRIVREAMDYDPLGDAGVPHVGAGPEYALAFVDASYGDRRMELVVRAEDAELARKVMRKMRKQGQTSGVQPTRQRFDPRDITTRKDLMRMLSEAAAMPNSRRMKELKDVAWAKVKERISLRPSEVMSVRIVPHQKLNARERIEPEFDDQMMMRVYVKDSFGRNQVFDVVVNLSGGYAEGIAQVR